MARKLRPWAVLIWLAVWQLAGMALAAAVPHGELLLATPLRVLLRLTELLPQGDFWRAMGRSAGGIAGGFLFSCLLALLLAALAAGRPWVRELLAPPVATAKSVPVASFVILALVWLDAPALPLFISGLMTFPPVYLNVLEGIRQTDPRLLELGRVFRVPLRRRLRGIYLPQVLPYFRSAVSLALGLCWKAGVAAEVIGLSAGTVGERLYTAKIFLQTPDLFAWTIVIVVLSAVSERLFLALLDALAGSPALSGDRAGRGRRQEQVSGAVSLEARDLRKSYGGRAVLKGLSFSAGRGITCVTAPSGAGKTTLLRLLLGLEEADGGTLSPAGLRWAAVFQEDRLLENLSAAGNLHFALGPEPEGAEELLRRLGLDWGDPRPVGAWSGGMKRRLSLARALLAPAEALALDEPFTGLDGENRDKCLALIREAAVSKPVLLVTHDPAGVQDLPQILLPEAEG